MAIALSTTVMTAVLATALLAPSISQQISKSNNHNDNNSNNISTVGDDEDSLDSWEAPSKIRNDYPYYISGLDQQNRPILVCEFGRWDLRQILDKGGHDVVDFEKYVDQGMLRFRLAGMQRGLKQVKEQQPNTTDCGGSTSEECEMGDGSVLIVDMESFSYAQLASPQSLAWILRTAGKLGKVADYVAYGFFINMNYVGVQALNLARPVLGGVMERIQVFGTNSAQWKPRILRMLPKDQLPEWYGGVKEFKPLVVYG